jgi:hypothetical protein
MMRMLHVSLALAALVAPPAYAASKTKEAIDAMATIIAVEQVASTNCPKIGVNQAAHTQYLQDINPEKSPAFGPKDNKDVDVAVEKHVKELRADIEKLGAKNWCASSLELFGAKGFAYPILETKPANTPKP